MPDPFKSLKSYVNAKSYFVGKEYLQIVAFKNVCLGLLRKGGKVPFKKYSLSGLGWEWLAFFYSLQNNVYSQVGHERKRTSGDEQVNRVDTNTSSQRDKETEEGACCVCSIPLRLLSLSLIPGWWTGHKQMYFVPPGKEQDREQIKFHLKKLR